MQFKKQNRGSFLYPEYLGLPYNWHFVLTRPTKRRDFALAVRGLGLFLASVGSFVLYGVFRTDPAIIPMLVIAGMLALPVSISWMKNEWDWRVQAREASATLKEPRVIEVFHVVPNDKGNPDWEAYRQFVYHHHKNGKYFGTWCLVGVPRLIEREYSVVGSSELHALCSACNTRYKCVRFPWPPNPGDVPTTIPIENEPVCTYWLGPHENCPKFPNHPEYNVDQIFKHSYCGDTHSIDSVQYLNHNHLPGASDPYWESLEQSYRDANWLNGERP